MHIHILGICGTFMGGIAALAQQSGHRVTGCDQNVYPPMSTQLESLGIKIIEGWSPDQLALQPDLFVIGNVVSRGNPLMEAILDARAPFISGPQWLGEHVLANRRVIAVAGTHGKTTTSAITAWLLQHAGLSPGFLIGGVVEQLDGTAKLGDGDWFVVEADEYDTAFFDKRAKFVHYRPEVAVLNNLEFDHADIYSALADIEWQFHQLLRIVPARGRVVVNADDANLRRVLEQGCWSPVHRFSSTGDGDVVANPAGAGRLSVTTNEFALDSEWLLKGAHNAANAAAAIAAVADAGMSADQITSGLASFRGVKRRLEALTQIGSCWVYDDFAHHPTAIAATLEAVKSESQGRVIAVFEPRSNTMRAGVHAATLSRAFATADALLVFSDRELDWRIEDAFAGRSDPPSSYDDAASLGVALADLVEPDDTVVLLSNGALGGLREWLLREYPV